METFTSDSRRLSCLTLVERHQGERDLSLAHIHTPGISNKYTIQHDQVQIAVAWLSLDGTKMALIFLERVVISESVSEPKGI